MKKFDHIAQLLQKYAEGECSPEEKAIVEQWYESLRLKAPAGETSGGDALWERIAGRTQPAETVRPSGKVRRIWWAAAAAVAMLVTAALFYPGRESVVRLTAAAGKIHQVSLPDGSRMWLSAGSSVHYEANFAGGRRVELESGEAFFDVARDDARPFTVDANGTRTLVLGTAFRVSLGATVEVAVVSGKVKVTAPDKKSVTLLPRETVAISAQATIPEVKAAPLLPAEKLNTAPARTGWEAQHLDLDDVSMGELAQLLENVYNVHIRFAGAHLRDCRNTISIDTGRPLTEVLDKLKLINHFEYTITNEGVSIDGAGCGTMN
ncbi:FecR family protein [Chitinophaga lutea]|uniref:FecR family protein n=1 Tax=Chitinophaga lutea TaxID=2488634 RepID=UPI001315ADD9|nr:FecR domain-containing protein [Chitinophaga lutea]